jgi:hypothetical protein
MQERHMNISAWLCFSALTVASIPSASASETIGFFKDGGGTFQPYEVNGVPLLDSFHFLFTDYEDRNIQAISVQPASPVPDPCFECSPVPEGQIFLTFQDEEGDEAYFYRVSHVELSAPVTRHRDSDYCRKSCSRLLDPKPRDSVFVIVGFSFFYPGRDHHVERIGIWEENGVLEVHFHDYGDDDLFRYELEYVYLPASMVALQGNVSGTEALGSDSATLPFQPPTQVPGAIGPTVLRGFDFVFLGELDVGLTYDQEIREIGVRTPGNKVEVFFANEELDRFNWGIDWAALANVPVSDPGTPRR